MDTTKDQTQLTTLPADTNAAVTNLFTIENLIKTHVSHIESVKTELHKHAEMMNDVLNIDEAYKKASDEVKEIDRKRPKPSKTSSSLLPTPL